MSMGYPTVMFSDGRKRHKVFAHRVVWMALYQSDIPGGYQVNHKNGKRGDTRPENLEVVTVAENVRHACRILGRRPKQQYGEKNAQSKLRGESVAKIRLLSGQMPQSKIAKMFGVTQSAISAVITGKSWGHLSTS